MPRCILFLLVFLSYLFSGTVASNEIQRRQEPLKTFVNGGFDGAKTFTGWTLTGGKGFSGAALSPGANRTAAAASLIAAPAPTDGKPSNITLSQTFTAPVSTSIYIYWWWGHWCLVKCCCPGYSYWTWCYWPYYPYWQVYLNGKLIGAGRPDPKYTTVDINDYLPASANGTTSSSGKNTLSVVILNADSSRSAGLAVDNFVVSVG